MPQKLNRRCGVFDRLCLVEFLIERNCFVPIVAFVGELYAALEAPEQIWSNGDEAVRRIPIGDATNVVVDAKDLLKHDDAWSIATRRQGNVGIELATIERLDCDHIFRDRKSTRLNSSH